MSVADYSLRELRPTDAAGFVDAYAENEKHLAPWEPIRADSFFTEAGQEDTIRSRLADNAAGRGASWVVTLGERIVGRVDLSNVARGPFQSCSIGYWIGREHTGRGLATMAVNAACDHARSCGLHRVEGATIESNTPSQRVLARCGFTLVGTAPGYLFIAGRWQDHRIYQRLLHDHPPS
jgi:ribosomal-protein-alanine N-acetyltransferase